MQQRRTRSSSAGRPPWGTVSPVGETDWVAISRRGTVLGYHPNKATAAVAISQEWEARSRYVRLSRHAPDGDEKGWWPTLWGGATRSRGSCRRSRSPDTVGTRQPRRHPHRPADTPRPVVAATSPVTTSAPATRRRTILRHQVGGANPTTARRPAREPLRTTTLPEMSSGHRVSRVLAAAALPDRLIIARLPASPLRRRRS